MRSTPPRRGLRRSGGCVLADPDPRRFFEHADEEFADRLALAFGVDDVVERVEEPIRRLHVYEIDRKLLAERALHLLRLAQTQQAGVDEDAGELVADGLVHQRRRDRAVDTTRQPADHALGADLGADLGDRVLDDRHVGPRRPAARAFVEERLEHRLAVLGVHHLGVELHAVDRALAIFQAGDRHRIGVRSDDEARGRSRDGVAVTHPHDLFRRLVGEQR